MRLAMVALSALVIGSVAGCGGGGLAIGNGDGGVNKPADLAQPAPAPDLTMPPFLVDLSVPPILPDLAYVPPTDSDGVSCGLMTCAVGEVCCVSNVMMQLMGSCMPSCPDSSFTVACDGPEDCGGNPCCAMFSAGGGGANIGSIMCTQSPTDCQPTLDIQTRSGTTRLCHVDADCGTGGTGFLPLNTCCTANYQGTTAHICLNPTIAMFSRGAVTCP